MAKGKNEKTADLLGNMLSRKRPPVAPVQEEKKESRMGRPEDFPDERTGKVTVKLPATTIRRLKVALATTHAGHVTQNRLVNALILAALDDPTTEQTDQ